MKSIHRAAPLLLFATTLLLVLPGKGRPSEGNAPGPAEVRYPQDAPARWDQLFDRHDAAGLAGEYSESAVSMPFYAPALNGRKALRADFEKFFAENDGARHETRVVEGGREMADRMGDLECGPARPLTAPDEEGDGLRRGGRAAEKR